MLEYDKIDISEGIDVNKISASKECDIFHYWYFKDIGFKYEPYLCNGCHDLMQKAMKAVFDAIVYVKGSAYRIHFRYMSKDDAISITSNSNLVDEKGVFDFCVLMYKKWVTYYQRNRDVILNRAKDYYENDKERLREHARGRYRNLSKEEKHMKRQYGKNRYHNMSKEKKQRLKEYQKNYRGAKKSLYNN